MSICPEGVVIFISYVPGGVTNIGIIQFPGSPSQNTNFLGNSLTYTNDLPAVVQAIAEKQGKTFTYRAITVGGYSLEDHWNDGFVKEALAEKWNDQLGKDLHSEVKEIRERLQTHPQRESIQEFPYYLSQIHPDRLC